MPEGRLRDSRLPADVGWPHATNPGAKRGIGSLQCVAESRILEIARCARAPVVELAGFRVGCEDLEGDPLPGQEFIPLVQGDVL